MKIKIDPWDEGLGELMRMVEHLMSCAVQGHGPIVKYGTGTGTGTEGVLWGPPTCSRCGQTFEDD